LLDAIILHYDGCVKFQEEIDFLKEQNRLVEFPYRKIKQIGDVDSGYDSAKNLPYVMQFYFLTHLFYNAKSNNLKITTFVP
jgi:hypothetical protein